MVVFLDVYNMGLKRYVLLVMYTTIQCSQVFRCAFWMLLHGSLSSKRTVCFSNGEWIQHLDLGTLSAAQRISQTKIEPTSRGP